MNKEILETLGLNENELLVYKEILSIGSTSALVISKRTNINKSTVRYICQSLEKKWVIFSIKKDGTFIYSAESPKRFLSILEKDKKKLEEKEKKINSIIEYFESVKDKNNILPKVTFFEGKQGIQRLYQSILDMNTAIDSIEDNGEMYRFFPEFVDYFIAQRKKRKIHNRVICPSKNPINVNSKQEHREVKTIDETIFPFSWDIKICGNHVSIISFKDDNSVGISITDEDIANNFRQIFDYIWRK